MVARRVAYRLLFPLAFVLPIWVLIARGIVLDGIGWDFIGYLILCPILFVALLVIGGLMVWRPGAREERAVTTWDTVVLGLLWAVLIATGFVAHSALILAAVVLVLVGFWLAVWELITEGRRRMQAVMDEAQRVANGPPSGPQRPIDIGEVIVVTSEEVTPPHRES